MADNVKVTRKALADYRPAPDNPNQHNERGLQIIEDSINYNGAGRSGLAAADGTLLAGNGTWEAMQRAGIEEVVEIEIDGKQWVVVKRNDLAPTDPRAKALMIADNRASQVDYTPDNELLAAILGDIATQDERIVKAAGYNKYELENLLRFGEPPDNPWDEWRGMPEFEQEDKTAYQSIHVHFKNAEDVQQFAQLIGQSLTDKTRSIWFPEIEIESYADKGYIDES